MTFTIIYYYNDVFRIMVESDDRRMRDKYSSGGIRQKYMMTLLVDMLKNVRIAGSYWGEGRIIPVRIDSLKI